MTRVIVAIVTPLQPELASLIRETDDRLLVRFEPDLLPPTRYPNDHRGVPDYQRDRAAQDRWNDMVGDAEVLFGLPGDSADGLSLVVRSNTRLRWVQATSAGAAEQVRAAGLSPDELNRVVITTASGVHAVPLAEFCIMSLLALTKNLPRLLADQRARNWNHYVVAELRGRTLLIVGLGAIGTEVARLATTMGMRVLAVTPKPRDSAVCERVEPPDRLRDLLPDADAVVLTVPLTRATNGLIGREAFDLMKPGTILVNVGRGGVIDEAALVEALRTGRLGGAALDVFATEPLPSDSPLWDLPNVIVSPHTAALSANENARIVALFRENLRRYLHGTELINRVDPAVLDL